MVYVKVSLNSLLISIILSLLSIFIIHVYLCSVACNGFGSMILVNSSGSNLFLFYAN